MGAVRRDCVIIGPPSCLSAWTTDVVKALVERSRSARVRQLDRTDTIDKEVQSRRPGQSKYQSIQVGHWLTLRWSVKLRRPRLVTDKLESEARSLK
jgi:hypothetical protein